MRLVTIGDKGWRPPKYSVVQIDASVNCAPLATVGSFAGENTQFVLLLFIFAWSAKGAIFMFSSCNHTFKETSQTT